MITTVTYENKTYTEANNNEPVMSNKSCACGNKLYVPLAIWVLGLVTDCGHCTSPLPFPSLNHSAAITQSYVDLIADGGHIEL